MLQLSVNTREVVACESAARSRAPGTHDLQRIPGLEREILQLFERQAELLLIAWVEASRPLSPPLRTL